MTERMGDEESAEFLLTVLLAHGSNVGNALDSAQEYFRGRYTVTRMIEDHIALLTDADGYTVRRCKGNLRCHIAGTLGQLDATEVEYRNSVKWIKIAGKGAGIQDDR